MKIAKRWGVMALVALMVLGSMGAALADEGTNEEETAKVPLDQGPYTVEWAEDLMAFVFYWGFGEVDEPPGCETSESEDPAPVVFFPTSMDNETLGCVPLNVEGPNGQVNHGSMVSSFVHWLKKGNTEMLSKELLEMSKGQLVKRFAHDDFGKGFFDLDPEDAPDVDAEVADRHGPPEWVKDKKAAKTAAKGKKNK